MAKQSTKSKRIYKRKSKAPRRRRAVRDVPDIASLSTKRTLATPAGQPAFNTGTLYSLMNTQLAGYNRAEIVGSQYQHFRIKKITVTFKPSFDNFLAAGGAVTKPNLYWMIDKSGAVPTNITLEGLKQMGAKPRQLDEKNMTISWRPSVLEGVMYAPGAPGAVGTSKYKISPWLSTQAGSAVPGAFVPSGIDHLGLYWFMDCLNNPAGIQYTVEVEVQFQFKKPLAPYDVGAPEALKAQLATINNSPDGVAGTADDV